MVPGGSWFADSTHFVEDTQPPISAARFENTSFKPVLPLSPTKPRTFLEASHSFLGYLRKSLEGQAIATGATPTGRRFTNTAVNDLRPMNDGFFV